MIRNLKPGFQFYLLAILLAFPVICITNIDDNKIFISKIKETNRQELLNLVQAGYDIIGFNGEEVFIMSDLKQFNNLSLYGYQPEFVELFPFDNILFQTEDFGSYHTYEEVVEELFMFEDSYPDIAKVYEIGSSIENRIIYALKISDNPEIQEDERSTLIVGCHHAREIISVEIPLFFADYLLRNYLMITDIKYLVENREIWIVPMLNPDGHKKVVEGYDWRKNLRDNGDGSTGVDLNRNYSFKWGYDNRGSSKYGWDSTFRGKSAFSEPESICMRDLFASDDIRICLSYHSYGNMMLMPWSYNAQDTEDHDLYFALASELTIGSEYEIGNAKSGTLYITNGGMNDWIYGVYHDTLKSFSYTVEVGTEFITPESKRIPLCEENLSSCLTAVKASGFFLEIGDFFIEDSGGNKNSIIEPGESGRIYVSLKNMSIDDVYDVRLNFHSNNPGFRIDSSITSIDYIEALKTTDNNSVFFDFVTNIDEGNKNGQVDISLYFTLQEGVSLEKHINLRISSRVEFVEKYRFDFSLDPDWETTGSWEHGTLVESNYQTNPPTVYIEPVYATDIDRDFRPRSRSLLTSSPIDVSDLVYTRLKFRKILNAPEPKLAKASIQISGDKIFWDEIWCNDEEIDDSSWTIESLNIFPYCVGKKEVCLRFVLTSYSDITDSGWIIDDVVIEGIPDDTLKSANIPIWISYYNAMETYILLDNINPNKTGYYELNVINRTGNNLLSKNEVIEEYGTVLISLGNYLQNDFGWGSLAISEYVIPKIYLFNNQTSQFIPIQIQSNDLESPVKIPFLQASDSDGYDTFFLITNNNENLVDIDLKFYNPSGEFINSKSMSLDSGKTDILVLSEIIEEYTYGNAVFEHDCSSITLGGLILDKNTGMILPINHLYW